MGREAGWDSETKLCSLTTTNSAAGYQLSIWKQLRRTFATGPYLRVGSQCQDIKERQYLHKRTEVLRSVRNRIKNWHTQQKALNQLLTPKECVLWVTVACDHLEGTIAPGTIRKEQRKWNKSKRTVEIHGYITSCVQFLVR